MKNCFMWKHHGHTVPCHFGCTDVCQIGVSRANNRDSGGPFLENFVASLNPVAWYRYGAGITVTGAGVSSWTDQSGNGNHLLQGTDTNRPALQADNSILFDGTDNYLKAVAFTLVQPETVYLLMKQVTWTAADYIFDGNTVNSGALRQVSTTPRIDLFAGAQSSADNAGLAVDTWGVVTGVINGESSITMVNNTLTSNSGALSGDMSGFTLGARGDGAGAWSNIQVKEAIIFPVAHDAGQRAKVIAYLAQVGNLTI
jgi:hypothetical protein